jgi:predicted enzyme related to lactoylglutathione lyase
MIRPTIAAVMVHVSNVAEALVWYNLAFRGSSRHRVGTPEHEVLQVGEVLLEFVPSDSKVSSGPSGSVVYWNVAQFEEALSHFQSVGAKLYRGPMQIEEGQSMCQVQDPWFNCIGLRGPSTSDLAST